MRPRLRAGCPLLGRCCVVGHCDERRAEHRDKNRSKKQTSHHVPPQMAVRVKSYIPKTGCCEIRNGGTENRRRLLAEMSHRIVFGFAAVAGSAHAALPSNITISQNRGDASAREPRTYHGRGFSLWPPSSMPSPTLSRLGQVRRYAFCGPTCGSALTSQKRKILPLPRR